MSETTHPQPRQYDVVILGASGFTGKYVLRESLKFLNTPSSPLKSLAIAGRDPKKLTQILSWASGPNPNPKPNIAILEADTSSPTSLQNLATSARVVLNCVGPFRLHGDPVVRACIEAGCDYLDICGEPEFMEKSEVELHERAVEKGSLVISACGFDSIPAELGLMFNSKQWASPKEALNKVEAYLSIESDKKLVGNFGTYESAVLGIANAEEFINWRRSTPKRPRPMLMESDKLITDDHEQEEYVLLDLDAVCGQVDIPPNEPYILSGLDTLNPMLTIGDNLKLIGEYEETIGTCLIFSENETTPIALSTSQASSKQVKPVTRLEKIIKFRLLSEADEQGSTEMPPDMPEHVEKMTSEK